MTASLRENNFVSWFENIKNIHCVWWMPHIINFIYLLVVVMLEFRKTGCHRECWWQTPSDLCNHAKVETLITDERNCRLFPATAMFVTYFWSITDHWPLLHQFSTFSALPVLVLMPCRNKLSDAVFQQLILLKTNASVVNMKQLSILSLAELFWICHCSQDQLDTMVVVYYFLHV